MAEEEKVVEEVKEEETSKKDALVPPVDKEKVPDTWFWLRGSDGNASVTTTFVLIAFWVVTLVYIASVFQSIGPVEMRAFDVGAASVYWIPLLSLYFGRRFTDAKYGSTKSTDGTKK